MRDAERERDHTSAPLRVSASAGLDAALFPDLKVSGIGLVFEEQARALGYQNIAGVDEVGRGCLAGPVVAAACILDCSKPFHKKLDDSKKLTAALREEIAEQLKTEAICYGIGQVAADEIDRINILEATKKAMKAAIADLEPKANFLLIDAVQLRDVATPQRSIIKGDSISASIAAASILAKTYRDRLMADYDAEFPGYGFASHAGYGTAAHLEALKKHGPCRLHRLSFRGVLPSTSDPAE
ncbi:MAG: ribonuclease HII [Pyrinomonadaceae bacterium]